jgi:hydroxyisourate hydrolase
MDVAGVQAFDALPDHEAAPLLQSCCGSQAWVQAMLARRPFGTLQRALDQADDVWWSLGPEDWREAFDHHPRIGERTAAAPQGEAARAWSAEEQRGASAASEHTRDELARGNREYERRFGHIYLVRATGRSAEEMLALLRERLSNDPETELRVAAGEQAKITRLRLEKLFGPSSTHSAMISTHVLDTSRGQPAVGVSVILERLAVEGSASTREMARAKTDADGRVPELLPNGRELGIGRYRLTFDTGSYFASAGVEPFYPSVMVTFVVRDTAQHYHIPLLLSPYGYSTYRGS